MNLNYKLTVYMVILALVVNSANAFTDSDLDGVDDSVDECPDTPFDQLVGKNGCPIDKEKGQIVLKIGGGLTKDSNYKNILASFSVGYSYKDWYFSILSNYYLYDSFVDGNGFGDTYIYGSYSLDFYPLFITAGLTVGVPTGDKNLGTGTTNLTPSFTVDYIIQDFDIFLSYGFVFRGNNSDPSYTVSIGNGYQFDTFYLSGSFDFDSENGRYLSFYGIKDITDKYFFTINYSYGLNKNATKHFLSFYIGVRM
jgi:hypothetical protein